MVVVHKIFKGISTEIEIEKTGVGKAHIRVQLEEGSGRSYRIRVTLKKGERDVSSFLLDEGYALFEEIPFGQYELIFSENGDLLGTYSFEIKESQHGGR